MKMITMMSSMMWIILSIMILMLNLLSKKTFSDREKCSPFECGFDPKNSARMPFSLQFFLIAMIFIIFDVELTLLLPMIMAMKISNIMSYTLITLMFILILLLGLYHEWNQGALTWVY
uniref:NADH-ubiquinone oxidoreductase chain 3 n=1 Tax=Sitona obsoletus TaxID=1541163 RepID=A0A411LWK7_9CUCU|nr:NADH dehydrogenase subunit 3 [Sitona obsoletus]QBF03826.1 NADH dehydrogenase subunit 3 [Sitona obsoletus]